MGVAVGGWQERKQSERRTVVSVIWGRGVWQLCQWVEKGFCTSCLIKGLWGQTGKWGQQA